MKRSVRTAALILAVVMLALTAAGCGSTGSGASSLPGLPTIEEQILLDSEGVTVTAKGMEYDSSWGFGVDIFIENATSTDITVSVSTLVVNDFMITPSLYSKVAAGQDSDAVIYLTDSALKEAGITTVGKIELALRVIDSSSYSDICSSPLTELRTSAYGTTSETEPSGVELYNVNGIRILGLSVDTDDIFGTEVVIYIENNSADDVIIHTGDLQVNGYTVTGLLMKSVLAGRKALTYISLLSTDLENCGIETISDVVLSFEIIDADSCKTIAVSSPITLYTAA